MFLAFTGLSSDVSEKLCTHLELNDTSTHRPHSPKQISPPKAEGSIFTFRGTGIPFSCVILRSSDAPGSLAPGLVHAIPHFSLLFPRGFQGAKGLGAPPARRVLRWIVVWYIVPWEQLEGFIRVFVIQLHMRHVAMFERLWTRALFQSESWGRQETWGSRNAGRA